MPTTLNKGCYGWDDAFERTPIVWDLIIKVILQPNKSYAQNIFAKAQLKMAAFKTTVKYVEPRLVTYWHALFKNGGVTEK